MHNSTESAAIDCDEREPNAIMERDVRTDFFISYTSADRAWAEWIAWQLEQAGYSAVIQAWDFRPGSNFVQEMDSATKGAKRTLAVLSPDYFNSGFTPSEWQAAFRRDPKGEQRLLVPVRVRKCDVEGLLGSIVYLDLVGHDEQLASARLLVGVRDQRAKPTAPPAFPSPSHTLPEKPGFPGAFPSVWTVPSLRNPFFTGREELLTQLTAALRTGSATALSQPQAISGLGGIGKTQVAVEYAYRSHADYQAVFWVHADTRENAVSDFVTIAGLLQLPEKDVQDQMIVVHAVKQWLSTHTKWLLILDNADDLVMVREFLPPIQAGHLLLTTRAPVMGRLAQRIEVRQLQAEVGALFLLRRAGLLALDAELPQAAQPDREAALEFTSEVDGLPLALDQAGAYIEEISASVQDYLRLYRQQQGTLRARRGEFVADHPASVATTWSLSFEQVEQRNPAAADLLRVCAFLHPDAIPEALIREGASQLGRGLTSFATDELALNEAILTLCTYSLVRRDLIDKALSLHRLVQAVLKDAMSEATQQLWAERVVRAVNTAFPEVEFRTWERCQEYLPHVLTCNTLIESRHLTLPEASRLLNRAGWYLEGHAQYTQAEPLYQRALAIYEQVRGPDHPDTAATLSNLANLYRAQGRYTQAEPLYQRALATYEQARGHDHPGTANILNNLANLYRVQGRYAEAEPLFLRALATYEQARGHDHPGTSTILNNLAHLYQTQERYAEAEPLYQRALAIKEKELGYDHPETAITLNNLANLYRNQERYAEAEPLYQRALAIREKALLPPHPSTAGTFYSLANLYELQGRYEAAELFYQRALAIYEQALPPDHPSIARILSHYASLLRKLNRPQDAQALEQRAAAIHAKRTPRRNA